MADTDKQATGVVLLNLGGPDSLQAVRPFLFNLFSDREIIRLGPAFLQTPIAWLISTLRSKKTEAMYRQIGGKSPILDITKAQAEALEKALNGESGVKSQELSSKLQTPDSKLHFKVYIGMRYWHPYFEDMVKNIISDGVKNLIVLSMYPHYSKATTGSSIDEFNKAVSKLQTPNSKLQTQYIDRWYDFPPYIDALAEIISEGLSEFSPPFGEEGQGGGTVLYSAHSLPQSFIDEGDPYLEHIKATISAVNSSLVTRHSLLFKWRLSFQSKTGPVKWLEPSTEEAIMELAREGCKNLFVVPISFVSDHIETLYEIDILYKNLAQKHGIILSRCRALNTTEKFIHAMRELVMGKTES
ncbi:MAG: ferrochelatase [Nitrospirae bacterium]|nr:ferrochelatase [Nitrospirota bacterium]